MDDATVLSIWNNEAFEGRTAIGGHDIPDDRKMRETASGRGRKPGRLHAAGIGWPEPGKVKNCSETLDEKDDFAYICVSPTLCGSSLCGREGWIFFPSCYVDRWSTLTFAGVTDCRKDVKSRFIFGSPHGSGYAKGLVRGASPLGDPAGLPVLLDVRPIQARLAKQGFDFK